MKNRHNTGLWMFFEFPDKLVKTYYFLTDKVLEIKKVKSVS